MQTNTTTTTSFGKGVLFGALSAACYGVNPIALLLYSCGYSIWVTLSYRYLLAAIFVGILYWFNCQKSDNSFGIDRTEFGKLFILGLLFALSSLFLFASYYLMPVSIASTLLFCYPAFVALIMAFRYNEPLTRAKTIGIIAVAIGIFMLNVGGTSDKTDKSYTILQTLSGIICVMASSLSYAIYIVAAQTDKVINKMSSLKLTLYSLLFGSVLFVIPVLSKFIWPEMLTKYIGAITLGNLRNWIIVISLALFPTVISISFLAKSVKHVGSTTAAILGAIEPITAVIIGMFLFGERPTALAFAGMAVIFAGIWAVIRKQKS